MCNKRFLGIPILTLLCAVLWSNPPAAAEEPLGTAFTYQGELEQGGVLLTDICQFEFALFDNQAGDVQIGETLPETVEVVGGRFTILLDFGNSIFTGEARFLEIAVCCSPPCGEEEFTTLSPLQELTPTPYALHTPSAESAPWSGLTDVPDGFADDLDNDALGALSCANGEIAKWDGDSWVCGEDIDTDTMYDGADFGLSDQSCAPGDVVTGVDATGLVTCGPDADTDTLLSLSCSAGEIAKWNSDADRWECAADDAGAGGASTLDEAYDGGGVGAGRTITADAGAVEILDSGGLIVEGTIQSGQNGNSIIIDGMADTITSSGDLELHVSDGRALRLETNATSPNLIGGFSGNSLESGTVGATIAGGGAASELNRVLDDYASISGGWNNTAGSDDADSTTARFATVAGGKDNTASGLLSSVGGGQGNITSGEHSTVGGGRGNTATNNWDTVGGGQFNTASGQWSTVGGGQANSASGGWWTTVAGGIDNEASDDASTVGGGQGNIASSDDSTIGGGELNVASGDSSTVGGGDFNTASAEWATVGGGNNNEAAGSAATVAGGRSNVVSADFGTIAGGGESTPGNSTTANFVLDGYGTVSGGGNNKAGSDDADPTTAIFATVGGGFGNTASETSSTVGGGAGNHASGTEATVGAGFSNTASGDRSTVGGGNTNEASGQESTIGGGRGNVVSAGFGTIAGGGESAPGNSATANSVYDDYGTIGGGGNNKVGSDDADPLNHRFATVGGGDSNSASFAHSTVGGGEGNTASGTQSTVGGGQSNIASGLRATIGGGDSNTASGISSTVGGGLNNTASGDRSTVGGGNFNTASGIESTVGGGLGNTADGDYSLAAGRRAKANHNGAFVWGDSTDAEIASTAPDQFLIRASGGVGIGTPSPTEQLDVAGNIHSSGTITSGSSITIDGTTDTITASGGTLSFDDENLTTSGQIESTMGGFKLPDGTIIDDASDLGGDGGTLGVPVGTVTAWLKSFPNTPSLQDGWVECNGQVLSDPDSVYDGQTIPPLNSSTEGAKRFLRGSTTSGGTGGATAHSHGSSCYDGQGSICAANNQGAGHIPPYYEVVWIMKVK